METWLFEIRSQIGFLITGSPYGALLLWAMAGTETYSLTSIMKI